MSITCKHWVPCVGERDPKWRRIKAVEFFHNPLSSIVYLVHPAIILHGVRSWLVKDVTAIVFFGIFQDFRSEICQKPQTARVRLCKVLRIKSNHRENLILLILSNGVSGYKDLKDSVQLQDKKHEMKKHKSTRFSTQWERKVRISWQRST